MQFFLCLECNDDILIPSKWKMHNLFWNIRVLVYISPSEIFSIILSLKKKTLLKYNISITFASKI